METARPTIVLSDKRYLNATHSLLIGFALLLFMTGAGAFTFAMVTTPNIPWERLPAAIEVRLQTMDWGRALLAHVDFILITALACAQSVYMIRAQKLERLILSPAGIRYVSPLPLALKRFKPDWSLPWDEVIKIELTMAGTMAQSPDLVVLMTFITSTGRQRIFPTHWVDSNFKPSFFRFNLSFRPAAPDSIRELVMATPVTRYVSDYHPAIPVDSSLRNTKLPTSLERNLHGQVAIGIIMMLILYAIVDFVADPDAYADDPHTLAPIFLATGVAAALLSGAWLYRSALTQGEKIGLAALIGMIAAVAMIPGALRINALTDTVGPTTYDYHVSRGTVGVILTPVTEGPPIIDYFANDSFWDKFGRDDTYPVQVRKGALGFYQFNLTVIVDEIHKHKGR